MRNELPIDVKNRKIKENVISKNPWKTLRKPFRSYSIPLSIFTISAQKMKFPIKDFFSKCGQIRRNLRIWSRLLKKSLMENFFFVQWMLQSCIQNPVTHLSWIPLTIFAKSCTFGIWQGPHYACVWWVHHSDRIMLWQITTIIILCSNKCAVIIFTKGCHSNLSATQSTKKVKSIEKK